MPAFGYLLFITSSACLVMSEVPSLALIGGTIWGMALLLGGYLADRMQLNFIMGLNILLLYWLSGSSNLFFLLIFGLPALVMAQFLARHQGYYVLQKWGMLSAVVLVSLFISLAYLDAGGMPGQDLQVQIDRYVQDSLEISEQSGLIHVYELQGISPEAFRSDLADAARWFFMHLPALFYLVAIGAVQLVLSLSAWFSRKKGWPILSRKPFREEIMPWQLAWLVIIALGLWLWGRNDMTKLYYIGSNLLLIAVPITAYFGLANLGYQWRRMNSSERRWGLSLIMLLALLFTPALIVFVSLLGLFDSLLDYRKLIHP